MKKSLLFSSLVVLLNLGNACSQSLDFFKVLGASGDDGAYDLQIDSDNNIYILGWYTGVVDLDPGSGISNVLGFGDRDIFLAKYDSVGNHIWSFGIGGVGQDEGGDLAIDSLGNVIIAGRFSSSVDFNPGVGLNVKASNGGRDFFIAKYSSSGNLGWVNAIGGAGYDDTEDMIVDGVGNIYVGGSFQITVDFDPGNGFATRISNGLDDMYLACYSSTGNINWVKTFGGNSSDDLSGIKFDGRGGVYCSGYFTGTTDFDAGAGVSIVTSLGSADAFILKYDVQGNFHWVETVGDLGLDAAYGLELFDDVIYLTGTFSNSVDFDPGMGVSLRNSNGSGDIFLSQFDTLGNFNWVNTAGGVGFDLGMDVAVDMLDQVICTGLFRSNSSFSGGANMQNLQALGDRDIFIDVFESSGNLLYVFPLSSVGVDNVNAFYYDRKYGSLFISGFVGGVTDFDPDTNMITPMNFSGVTDIFFAKYQFCDSIATLNSIYGSSLVCEGDTIFYSVDSLSSCLNCQWVFPPGSTVLDSLGADVSFIAGGMSGILEVFKKNTCSQSDTILLPLAIKNRPLLFVSDSMCTGSTYVFPDGTTGMTDTLQFSYLTAVSGCDSIIVTDLKVTHPVLDLDSIAICNGSSYFFNGVNLISSGSYSYTVSTPGFCDTTHSLLLSVLPPNLFLQNKIICDGDTLWVGSIAHTTTGVYIDTLVSSLFCDSIIISNVSQILIDTTVSISNGVYTSNQSNGTYQWYECGTVLSPVPNAIFQSYAVPTSGSYAVVINLNGCVDTSRCISVITSSFLDLNNSVSGVIVTPNPFMDQFNILSREIIEEVSVFSMDGKLLKHDEVNHTLHYSNLKSFSQGMYIVMVKTKSGLSQIRLIKL